MSGPSYATVQVAPLIVNDVGRWFVPVCVALKPALTVPPAATAPLYDSFTAVTAAPVCVQRALQPWPICWPLGKVKASVQDCHAVALVFRRVTLPVNPVDQSLVV